MARGYGLRVRLARIAGETAKGVVGHPLYLPAVIGGFGWTEEASHTEFDTVRAGQFSQPAMGGPTARSLRKLDDVETLTVEWDPPWLVEQGQDPAQVYQQLYAILRGKTPVELLATPKLGDRPLLRMDVTFRSIRAEMRRGEPDTMYYTIGISEWRKGGTERKGAGHGPGRPDGLPTTTVLKASDTLYSLSEFFYSSAVGADDIARANGITKWGKTTPLVKHPRYKVGSKIKIPLVVIASIGDPDAPRVSGSTAQRTTGS